MYLKTRNEKITHLRRKWLRLSYTKFRFYKHSTVLITTSKAAHLSSPSLSYKFKLFATSPLFASYKGADIYSLWHLLYQEYYFSTIYKSPVLLKNINAIDVVPQSTLTYMINSVRHIRWKKYFIMHSNEIVEILFLSIWLKNLKLFMDWMRKHFEKTNLKKHRRLFLLLNLLLGKFLWNYNIFFSLHGLRVVLLGKFGKAGSVRKTRRYIRRGKCSYTTKRIALINQTNVIRTLTGVFSIKFEVFY